MIICYVRQVKGGLVYMKKPLPFTVETSGYARIIPSPLTWEGVVGVLFIFRCAPFGHGC